MSWCRRLEYPAVTVTVAGSASKSGRRSVEVKGRWVELRVLADGPPLQTTEGPMLDPWVEFPPPAPQFRLRAKTGPLALPDPPHLPADGV